MKRIASLMLLAMVTGGILGGCTSAEPTATKAEEEAFRNPPKNPPAGLAPKGPPPGAMAGG